MKVLLIGNAGSGKSTLAARLQAVTGWPVLSLDKLWHADDYSQQALQRLEEAQDAFMATHSDWIIDGNYAGTMPARLVRADVVLWLQVPRPLAIARVLRRSWRFHRDPSTRPDMPAGFREHLDKDYLDFLRYVWGYSRRSQSELVPLLRQLRSEQQLVIIRSARQKRAVLRKLRAK